jgi:hypothetical protein
MGISTYEEQHTRMQDWLQHRSTTPTPNCDKVNGFVQQTILRAACGQVATDTESKYSEHAMANLVGSDDPMPGARLDLTPAVEREIALKCEAIAKDSKRLERIVADAIKHTLHGQEAHDKAEQRLTAARKQGFARTT